MYFNGGAYIIEIDNNYSERLINWANKGNSSINTPSNPFSRAGININFYLITKNETTTIYFMTIEHLLFFNYSLALMFIFMLQAIKIRKHYKIRTAKLKDVLTNEGLKWDKMKF
jgi:hypothetical protein